MNNIELKQELKARCAYIVDEKIDLFIKFTFYKRVLIHIMNKDNYLLVGNILSQFKMIYYNLVNDCDSELVIIYRKVLSLLEKYTLLNNSLEEISILLDNLNDLYYYRSSYEKEYGNYLKNAIDNPNKLFEQYCPTLLSIAEKDEILNYLDNMVKKR